MGRSCLGVRNDESLSRVRWTIWITLLLHSLTVTNPHKVANGLKREIFFLNLEDGFFGCQVNESVDVLKVFELSKLCDGSPQCFLGSDELHEDLKCSDDCTEKTGRKCENGACLSSQCYCNDGFGGKGCEMPDENECKFRPCDIFAHCTNTLGSFGCACFNGYAGDGFRCKDIDECKNPALRSSCVENAECWNLPGHFACRCLNGFEGDGNVECRDVNECLSRPCGALASCENKPGGYNCQCSDGFTGNAFSSEGCHDINECQFENPCRGPAMCQNTAGGFDCICPRGFLHVNSSSPACKQVKVATGCDSNFDCVNNAECIDGTCACRPGFESLGAACHDVDECQNNPCGAQAVCGNVPGGFRCECEGKFPVGDPFVQCKASCEDVNCGPHAYCSANELHSESSEAYCVCEDGWSYVPKNVSAGCIDINECELGNSHGPCGNHSICHNLPGSHSCTCQPGFRAEFSPQLGCSDVNECEEGTHNCGVNALCVNLIGAYDCTCPSDLIGDPRVKCSQMTTCQLDNHCLGNGVCDNVKGYCICNEPNVGVDCRHPCEKVTCGPRAECVLVNDQATCVCPSGFHGSPSTSEGCQDIDECLFQPCGEGICRNEPGRYRCECPLGFEPLRSQNSSGYPESCRSVAPRSCRRASDCPVGEECVDHSSNRKVCVCPRGFTRDFKVGECRDLNECIELDVAPCGANALCRNIPGSYECTCTTQYPMGNPYQKCEECTAKKCPCPSPYRLVNASCVMDDCSPATPCANGGDCIAVSGGNYCACPKGYTNGADRTCRDVNECLKPGTCGAGAECFNKPGSFKCVCPINHQGDPYKEGCSHPLLKCFAATDCAPNEQCVDPGVCLCALPYTKDTAGACRLNCDSTNEGSAQVCTAAQKRTCTAGDCGKNAECVDGSCVCKLGFEGNPYTNCEDLNECEDDLCGKHAHCLNLPGSYDCRCQLSHPIGNPFVECLELPQNLIDCTRSNCTCSAQKGCLDNFVCRVGFCVDECEGVKCGPNSACVKGKCVCSIGFSGEPPSLGCEFRKCENDQGCYAEEICYGTETHGRVCVDGCTRMECGPNSVCFTENHRSTCVCKEFFEHNGQDCTPVKISERVDECTSSSECFDGFVCSQSKIGLRACVDPCTSVICARQNQACVRENGRAVCKCKPGYSMSNGRCELPTLSECSIDDQCPKDQGCVQDGQGVGRCLSLCERVACGANAMCVPEVSKSGGPRTATCYCKPGFTGNPADREGCLATLRNDCVEDVDCSENHVCRSTLEGNKCQLACDGVACGPNAICVSNNHVAQCQCLPGKFKGDPSDAFKGCSAVPCIYNSDCQPHQTCNRLESLCHDVCTGDSCGSNAICIPERHSYRCTCAPGFTGQDGDTGCHPIKDCVTHNPCHVSGECVIEGGDIKCMCPEGTQGDPHGIGCEGAVRRCTSHEDCPAGNICRDHKCVDPCAGGCAGKHSVCRVVERMAICSCEAGFEASTRNNQTICTPITRKCSTDGDCVDGICVDKQCKVICSEKSDCATGEVCLFGMCMLPCIGHAQCPRGQSCAGGYCILGCRSNKDCPNEEACLNHQCSNPCHYDGACGTNSLCRPVSHSPLCYCPEGFITSPSDGCYRNNTQCSTTQNCPPTHICLGGACFLSCDSSANCVRGEQCQSNICIKVCYTDVNCHLGEICIEGVCAIGCRSDGDCGLSESCISSKCRCGPGFTSGPTGCRDINECDIKGSCHGTANCLNSPGTYRCVCPEGLIGDDPARLPCHPPEECSTDRDCREGYRCHDNGVKSCVDSCTLTKCGPRAECRLGECFCPKNHLGDAYSLKIGCQSVECEQDTDCTRDRYCDSGSGRCLNPCDVSTCGDNALCEVQAHEGICSCVQGFVLKNGTCHDVNECAQITPCHETAKCYNTIGGFRCDCPDSTVKDVVSGGCKRTHDCASAVECSDTADCVEGKCKLVCEASTCGIGAKCEASQHKAICSCLPNFIGDPAVACTAVACREESDCSLHQTCYKNECFSPCDIPHICGQHTNCTVISHKALCLCKPGYTGDPVLGCTRLLICDPKSACPAGSICLNGNCQHTCLSHRDCASLQSCIQGTCQHPCTFDSDCSTNQMCSNRFCKDADICRKNANCPPDQVCNVHFKCEPVCENTLCPTHSHCKANGHEANCLCDIGFTQDAPGTCVPTTFECQNGTGCIKKTFDCNGTECPGSHCDVNKECGSNEICSDSQCINPCDKLTPCGLNAECSTLDHVKRCKCKNGFTGIPEVECVRVASPCRASEDCLANYTCSNGICFPKCLSDNYCASNERCVENHCMLTCRLDNDCFLNHVCLRGMCVSGCRSDKDCPVHEICQQHKCVDLCMLDACGPNALCRTVEHQPKCSCPPGTLPNPSALVGCIREPTVCLENRDCINASLCISGTCRQPCSASGNCFSNEICHSGFCTTTCRTDGDCRQGDICQQAVCIEGCRDNVECKNDEVCFENKCSNPCKNCEKENCSCGSYSQCDVDQHAVSCICNSPYVGDPYESCALPEVKCDPVECPAGMSCTNHECRMSCASDAKCKSDERCVQGVCHPVCSQDNQCRDHEICQGRICIHGCRFDLHCPSNSSCVNRQCIDLCATSPCGSCANCETLGHRSVCTCPLDWIGDPETRCRRPHVPCHDRICPGGQTCLYGSCVASCQTVSDCPCLQSCHRGQCLNRCSGDNDCSAGEICEHGHCEPRCQQNWDCEKTESCVEGQCVDPCLSKNCSSNAHCKVAQHRPICLCANGSPEVNGECGEGLCSKDDDCKNVNFGCINAACKNPCVESTICGQGASCRVIGRKPLCTCPLGWTGSATTECVQVGKDDCRSKGCGLNASCTYTEAGYRCTCAASCVPRIPEKPEEGCKCSVESLGLCNLKCGTHAQCKIEDNNQKRCVCPKEFPEGDPIIGCSPPLENRVDDCRSRWCGKKAFCLKAKGQYSCQCPTGTVGNPDVECLRVDTRCQEDSDCSSDEACAQGQCQHLCHRYFCRPNQQCRVLGNVPTCLCNSFVITVYMELTCPDVSPDKCQLDHGCSSSQACIFGTCQDPCIARTCPPGNRCRVKDHSPYCLCVEAECSPVVEMCLKDAGCPKDLSCVKYQCQSPCDQKSCPNEYFCVVRDHRAVCRRRYDDDDLELSPVSSALVECSYSSDCAPTLICANDLCTDPCVTDNPCSADEQCRVVNQTISCQIAPPLVLINCTKTSQCPSNTHCNPVTRTCENPCAIKKCGPTSYCVVENQVAKCLCLEGGMEHEGNCIRRFRTDFPRPEMTVNCLADGIQVDILTGPFGSDFRSNGSEFNGLLYVKGHSKDPQCRKSVEPYVETVDFEVKFGSCGLIHNDGEASFVMVIQKHPRLVTYNAQAYDIKCVYMTGEKTITLGFNVSMLTTSGTIANTGPPPTCSMRIATATGGEITSAEIGESLVLRIDVEPSSIYGGFARRCVAKTMEGDGENEYPVTDEDGCASDPSVFGDWEFDPETQILMAHFNAFKFPSSSSIKFQCNVRVCFGTCPPVNCRGQEAFGRRRRSTDRNLLTHVGYEGQLREEVQIESNPILAIERREDRFQDPTESPQTLKEEVCISTTGFVVSLIVTSILSLVAVAVAVSCWILAYKRRKCDVGPLPHPPEFPNPLFSSTDQITEPLPDYMS